MLKVSFKTFKVSGYDTCESHHFTDDPRLKDATRFAMQPFYPPSQKRYKDQTCVANKYSTNNSVNHLKNQTCC